MARFAPKHCVIVITRSTRRDDAPCARIDDARPNDMQKHEGDPADYVDGGNCAAGSL